MGNICDDIGGWTVNTGVMFWRNTSWTRQMMNRWKVKEKLLHAQGAEQNQLIDILREEDPNRYVILSRKEFNQHPKEHKEGDFILHMMGYGGEERIKKFQEWNKKLGLMRS